MTPTEAVMLTEYVQACCPQQSIGEYTPDAWHDLLGDLSLADCRAAVAEVARRQPFVAPAEIRAEVRRIRRDRIERNPAAAPPPELTDDPAKYREALKGSIRRIADGLSIGRAVAALPSATPAPVAEVRKQLGPPITPSERHLPPEEIARRQVVASRTARGTNVIAGEVITPDADQDPAA
jgi:hypothetical protein